MTRWPRRTSACEYDENWGRDKREVGAGWAVEETERVSGGGIIYRQDGSDLAHLRKRLNDVAETSSLRERCALGADDDDVEAVEIAFRLHGDAGAGAASRDLDDVARTESAVRAGRRTTLQGSSCPEQQRRRTLYASMCTIGE